MEDGNDALESVESKLASVFESEMAAEAAAETPEQPVEEPVAEIVAEQEFQAPDPPPVEGTEEATGEVAVNAAGRPYDPETGQLLSKEAAEGRLYAGRYKTVEELERAVEEKEAFIARQGTDIGSVRQELEALRTQLQQPAQPAPQQSLPSNWETLVEENPAAAIEAAYRSGNEAGIQEAYRAWEDIAPGAPQLWYENKMLAQQVEGLSENFGRQTAAEQYREFARTHPDVDQYAGEMAEIAKQYPGMIRAMQEGGAAETEVLDFLYTKASTTKQARNADTLATAQSAADAEKNALLRQQKENAAVASATKSAAEKKPLSEGHQMLEEIRSAYGGPDILSGITTD